MLEAFDKLVNQMFKGWQYHFEMLNLTYLAYLMFADVTRKLFPGISESAIGKMVAGAYVSMFKPEEELVRLSKLTNSAKDVSAILKSDTSVKDKVAELKKTEAGKNWLAEYEKAKDPWFYVSCGSGWFHYEGSWLTDPNIPYSYIKDYVERLEKGDSIERSLDQIEKQRDEIVAEYRKLIKTDEDRKAFDDAYNTIRTIYRYAEDHLFWVEHWFHTIWFSKVRNFGQLLVDNGMLNDVDDIFMFNRYEIPQLLTELSTGWALGVDIPMRGSYYKSKAEKRRKILEAAGKWNPIPALGVPPEEVAEPFTIMLWGITTDKVKEWLKGVDASATEDVSEIKGFASSAGIVEGPARVLKRLKDIVDLQPGEILVCPSTNPSWAPVFTKIKAAVTDIGGLTSHAAIVCREYGIPSVTGAGIASGVRRDSPVHHLDLMPTMLELSGASADPERPLEALSRLDPLATILFWLGPVNIMLGLFNMVPGFPLDGGRVLRAILWGLTGDLMQATRWATLSGQGIAWLLIACGFAMIFGLQVPLLGSGPIAGLWVALIGWFLNNAALMSYQRVMLQESLGDLPVTRVMHRDYQVVAPATLVQTLVDEHLLGTSQRAFPVVEGDRLLGLVCLADVRKLAAEQRAITPVSELMTPLSGLHRLSPSDKASDAMIRLAGYQVNQLPVVEDGRLLGLISREDILKWLTLH